MLATVPVFEQRIVGRIDVDPDGENGLAFHVKAPDTVPTAALLGGDNEWIIQRVACLRKRHGIGVAALRLDQLAATSRAISNVSGIVRPWATKPGTSSLVPR